MITMKTSHQLAQAAYWLVLEAEQHAHQEALARHHNLLLTGICAGGSPMVSMETLDSMLAGCVALARHRTDLIEYIREEGALLFYGSPSALAAARQLQQDHQHRAQ